MKGSLGVTVGKANLLFSHYKYNFEMCGTAPESHAVSFFRLFFFFFKAKSLESCDPMPVLFGNTLTSSNSPPQCTFNLFHNPGRHHSCSIRVEHQMKAARIM